MLVAGHETTASVLTWTLHLLALHPEKLAKVLSLPIPALTQNLFQRTHLGSSIPGSVF